MKGHREFVFYCKNILSVDCLSKKIPSMLQRCCSTAALHHVSERFVNGTDEGTNHLPATGIW